MTSMMFVALFFGIVGGAAAIGIYLMEKSTDE